MSQSNSNRYQNRHQDRRQFLRGAAGALVALPWLPSLTSRAFAAEPSVDFGPPKFIALATQHGGVWTQNMYPDPAALTESQPYAGHLVRRGALSASSDGSITSLSPVLSASSSALTPSLVSRMNVMRGLDIPFYIAHHRGGHLGNYADNDGNGLEGVEAQSKPVPTIDQVMAWSESFYPDLSNVKSRSVALGYGGISWGWSDPSSKSGTVQTSAMFQGSHELFGELFVVPPEPGQPTKPAPLVDRVLESYQRLRNGNRRLSAYDRQRLDEHMERLHELERRLNVNIECGPVPETDSATLTWESAYAISPSLQSQAWQLLNEVITLGLSCGATRIVVANVPDTFSSFPGDWHQDVAHQAHGLGSAAQEHLWQAHQRFFEQVFVDLANRLQSVEMAGGHTLLDECLLTWTQESGNFTHEARSVPVITAGCASGALNTGAYLDYRNWDLSESDCQWCDTAVGDLVEPPGLVWNQYLHTVLQAMGVPQSEYASDDMAGYALDKVGPGYAEVLPDAVLAARNDLLPFFTKT